jgi:DNA-binding MarR family transcriptional regulator
VTTFTSSNRRRLSAVQRRLGALLYAASQAAQETADAVLAPLGLTVREWGLLTFVKHASAGAGAGEEHDPHLVKAIGPERNPLSQQAIGEQLRIDRTTMVSLVDGLEHAGLVRRERNPADRRAYVIRITPAGEELQARAERALDAMAKEFFRPLSEDDQRRLADMLTRLLEASS